MAWLIRFWGTVRHERGGGLVGSGPARALRAAVSERVAKLEGNGPLTLHMILVGDDPSARGYARAVQRGCKRVGVQAVLDELPGESSTDDVVDRVRALNADDGVHGILLGFPLAGKWTMRRSWTRSIRRRTWTG